MRAKLHEGLYTSLEQFEHDVYLISWNAMHFNSSGTIFFRQAHGIHKLAKRVFHVLRTSPETFELEFEGTGKDLSEDPKMDLISSHDGKECDSIEVDQRSTYKPPLDLNNDKCSKSLIHLHQHMQVLKDALPPHNKLVGSFYETKKFATDLGLPCEKIDCCIIGCMSYCGEEDEERNRYREENQKVQGTRDREEVLTIQGIVPEKEEETN
ncbi:Bromodomain-containing protein [Artemisia annua]|uniref:Bromodomain-containing protein n=1 Tax=Artemisia annua TaxID=35608 RepID=A0A2U1NA56_ARTAN|nr:Bromodomain-containing protein [Artemisia annua]